MAVYGVQTMTQLAPGALLKLFICTDILTLPRLINGEYAQIIAQLKTVQLAKIDFHIKERITQVVLTKDGWQGRLIILEIVTGAILISIDTYGNSVLIGVHQQTIPLTFHVLQKIIKNITRIVKKSILQYIGNTRTYFQIVRQNNRQKIINGVQFSQMMLKRRYV